MTETGTSGRRAAGAAALVVLFDIGGVLAPFEGLADLRRLTGESEADAATRWLRSPTVRSFESGACDELAFARGVIAEWGFELSPEQFLEQFRGWLGDPYPGADALVCETASRTRVGCLSNTNGLQWRERISRWPLTARFQERLLSFELGAVKPDREIFTRALARLEVPAESVLLLDDNEHNVAGARAAGMRAEQALGVGGARAALVGHGLVAPG